MAEPLQVRIEPGIEQFTAGYRAAIARLRRNHWMTHWQARSWYRNG